MRAKMCVCKAGGVFEMPSLHSTNLDTRGHVCSARRLRMTMREVSREKISRSVTVSARPATIVV